MAIGDVQQVICSIFHFDGICLYLRPAAVTSELIWSNERQTYLPAVYRTKASNT